MKTLLKLLLPLLVAANALAQPVVESGTSENGQVPGGGDIGLTMPATRPDGDTYIPIVCFDGGTVIDTLGGFTPLVNQTVNSASDYMGVLWKIGSSEPASYTLNRSGEGTERGNTAVIRISGAHATTPIGAQAASVSEGTGSTATAPAITATDDDSIIIRAYCANEVFTAIGTSTPIAASVETLGVSSFALVVGYDASPGAGMSTGTNTATVDTGDQQWSAWTFEVVPPAGGGGTNVPAAAHYYRMMQ